MPGATTLIQRRLPNPADFRGFHQARRTFSHRPRLAPTAIRHSPMSPLTVLQVVPELEAGGVERGTLEVARELVRRGHRSLVISNGGRMVEQLQREGSTHIQCPIGRKSPLTLWQFGRMRRLLRDEHVDVVHARSRIPAWVTWLAWKSLPTTQRPHFVTTVHGLYSPNAYSQIMTRGEVVIAVSRTFRTTSRRTIRRRPKTACG